MKKYDQSLFKSKEVWERAISAKMSNNSSMANNLVGNKEVKIVTVAPPKNELEENTLNRENPTDTITTDNITNENITADLGNLEKGIADFDAIKDNLDNLRKELDGLDDLGKGMDSSDDEISFNDLSYNDIGGEGYTVGRGGRAA